MEELETENKVNFITCVKWVKKGVGKSNPEKVLLNSYLSTSLDFFLRCSYLKTN